jgi:hypothetical protein
MLQNFVCRQKNGQKKRFAEYSDEWLDFIVKNRNPEFTEPMHDCDMVEGPVADDRVQRNIDAFLDGRLSREKFLAILRFPHYETHQICFCSTRSLLMLKPLDKNSDINFEVEEAGEKILEQIVSDYRFTSEQATDIFYTSNTFTQLADCATKLYEKPWQEIYKLLINELNLKI